MSYRATRLCTSELGEVIRPRGKSRSAQVLTGANRSSRRVKGTGIRNPSTICRQSEVDYIIINHPLTGLSVRWVARSAYPAYAAWFGLCHCWPIDVPELYPCISFDRHLRSPPRPKTARNWSSDNERCVCVHCEWAVTAYCTELAPGRVLTK